MIEIVVRISPVSAGKILTANLGGFEGGTRVAGEAQLVLNAAGFSTPGTRSWAGRAARGPSEWLGARRSSEWRELDLSRTRSRAHVSVSVSSVPGRTVVP